MNRNSHVVSEPASPWSVHRVRAPLAGMVLTQTAAAMVLASVPVLSPETARNSGSQVLARVSPLRWHTEKFKSRR